MGYGLLTFCNGRVVPGFETLAKLAGVEQAIAQADLIITGEGSLDSQSLEGKGPVAVARMARQAGKPVIGLAGRVERNPALAREFNGLFAISTGPMTLQESASSAAELLRWATSQAVATIASLE